MKNTEKKKKGIVLLLSAALICQTLPGYQIYAAQEPDGICPHHTEHTAECGYQEAAACQFVCEECKNTAAESERLAAEAEKAAQEAQQKIDNVQSLISALPEAEGITAENLEDVKAQLAAIEAAKAELDENQQASLQMEKYTAAVERVAVVEGELEAERIEAELAAQESQKKIDNVQSLINALPEAEGITAENLEDVKAQLAAIEAAKAELDETQQASLQMEKYTVAVERVAVVEAERAESELAAQEAQQKIDNVQNLISALPEVEDVQILLENPQEREQELEAYRTQIKDAKAAYDVLPPEQQAQVKPELTEKLQKLLDCFAAQPVMQSAAPKVSVNDTFSVDNINYKITALSDGEVQGEVEIIESPNASGNLFLNEVTHNDTTYIITSVGEKAFFECKSLTAVDLPNITSIGGYAFALTEITSITLPTGLTSIGRGAFSACGLTSIILPASLTSIGDNAFFNCGSLSSVEMHGNTSIGSNAFTGCGSLSSVEMYGNTSIGSYAFLNCGSLSSVEMYGNTSIGSYAFFGCVRLASVKMLDVTKIEGAAFASCKSLMTLALPASLESIGEHAFANCSELTTLFCSGTKAPTLGSQVFRNVQIEKIFVPDGAAGYTKENGWPVEPTQVGQVEITGTVKDENGNPVSNASVRIEINGLYYYGTTNENGSYTISIPESVNEVKSYTIIASKVGYVSNEPVTGEITGDTITQDITIKCKDVASVTIGNLTQNYTDLDDAAKAVSGTGGTLTLLKNVSGRTQPLELSGPMTFDLGGHTLSGSWDGLYQGVVDITANEVQVTNGKVEVTESRILHTVYVKEGATLSGDAEYHGHSSLGNKGIVSGGTFNGVAECYQSGTIAGGTFERKVIIPGIGKLQGGCFENTRIETIGLEISKILAPGYVGYANNGNVVLNHQMTDKELSFTGEVRPHTPHTYDYINREDGNGNYTCSESSCPICGITAPEGAAYTVTIPKTAQLGSDTEVSVNNSLSQEKTVTVSANEKQVTLTRENDPEQTQIVSDVTFDDISVTKGETYTEKVIFAPPVYNNDPNAVIPAGTYKGTLTFTIGMQ